MTTHSNRSLFRESYESTKQLGRKGKGALTKMKKSVVDILEGVSPRIAAGKKLEKGNYLDNPPSYKGPEPLWNPLRMHPPGTMMQPPNLRNQLGGRVGVGESADSGVESTHHNNATKSDLAQIPSKVYCPSEFDAVVSSSPDGHSTPRVRAEPSFRDSSRFRQKVHSAHSLLDVRASTTYNPDIDDDEGQFGAEVSIEDGLKRKCMQEVLCSPKRTRKHSSPPPEDVKAWKDTMDELNKTSLNFNMRRQATKERGHRQRVVNRNRITAVMDVDEEDELNCNNPNYILTWPRKPDPQGNGTVEKALV